MRKKIVILVNTLTYGGAETQVKRISLSLKRRGWEITVISIRRPEAYKVELEKAQINLISLNINNNPLGLIKLTSLLSIIKKERPNILLSFMFHSNIVARLFGSLLRVPIIISSIRNENFGGNLRDKAMYFTDFLASITTTNSELAANKLVLRGVVDKNRIKVIPNGLDLDDFRSNYEVQVNIRKEFKIPDEDFVWITIGRLEDQKNYELLLRAVKMLRQFNNKFHLIIIGDGTLKNKLINTAVELEIDHLVHFAGIRSNIYEFMKCSDSFVLSSSWEGLPNVLIEAHAAGLPIVSTDVGGVREIVAESESGYIVPPNNCDLLCSSMRDMMLLDKDSRVLMGDIGRKNTEKRFELDSVIDQWEELFFSMLMQKEISR